MDSRDESLKLQAEFKNCKDAFTALGDETRQYLISIMIMESCEGVRVVDIAKKTALSRPAVSHHMQILKDAGFVNMRKDGTKIYYYLDANNTALENIKILISHVGELLNKNKDKLK